MNPNNLVSLEELNVPVRSDEALEWVESLLKRFYKSKLGTEFIRLKKGITQEILDELLPLSRYAKAYYNTPDVLLQFYPGCKTSYDADFICCRGSLIERVEVTMAIDGQQSRIQAEAIQEYGHSPIYQTPKFTGNSKNRKIFETESETISNEDIIKIQVDRIQKAYTNKHKNIHKYPNVTLLIGVDIPLFVESECLQILEKLNIFDNTFDSIKCVNTSSHQYWCLK